MTNMRSPVLTPASLLAQAIKAVPAVRWALAVGGVLSIPAIAFTWYKTKDIRVAALCVIVMLFLMMVMVIFAKAAGQPNRFFHWPALIFTWFCLLLFMAISCALFCSIFLNHPHLDWSFITHASADGADTPAEREAAKLEADGDSDAANGIYYGSCQWITNCSEYGQAFLPSRALQAWARAELHWQDARDRTNNSVRFARVKAKLDPDNSVSCRSDKDRRNASCEKIPKGFDEHSIGSESLHAARPDLPNPSAPH
jgi:hypothetical protein